MLQEMLKRIGELAARHPGKALGASLGLLAGLLVILFGVLRTLFLVACVVGGLYVGAIIDGSETRLFAGRSKGSSRWNK